MLKAQYLSSWRRVGTWMSFGNAPTNTNSAHQLFQVGKYISKKTCSQRWMVQECGVQNFCTQNKLLFIIWMKHLSTGSSCKTTPREIQGMHTKIDWSRTPEMPVQQGNIQNGQSNKRQEPFQRIFCCSHDHCLVDQVFCGGVSPGRWSRVNHVRTCYGYFEPF